jgi:hypothetical protein
MSSEKPVKHLVIEMEFRNIRDFEIAMEQIKRQVRIGIQESKEVRDYLRFEYGLCYLKEFDCRIENINGVDCYVIPSKMNKK